MSKITIELPDAFETVDVDVPDKLDDWYRREAAHKGMTVPDLLASKAAGLTVEQLRAVREHGKDVPEYVMRWILRQPHEIIGGDIPSAPTEAAVRRAPVQKDSRWPWGAPGSVPGTIPWSVHLRAWAGYDAAGHGNQSAERIAERGGFSYREVQCALLGHYNECGHDVEHPPVPGWEPA